MLLSAGLVQRREIVFDNSQGGVFALQHAVSCFHSGFSGDQGLLKKKFLLHFYVKKLEISPHFFKDLLSLCILLH